MGFLFYDTLILVPQDTTLSFDTVVDILKEYLSKIDDVIFLQKRDELSIQYGDWSFHLRWEDEPHVVAESGEIAALYTQDRADQENIAKCNRRMTLHGDHDPERKYFNNYVSILEAIEIIKGV